MNPVSSSDKNKRVITGIISIRKAVLASIINSTTWVILDLSNGLWLQHTWIMSQRRSGIILPKGSVDRSGRSSAMTRSITAGSWGMWAKGGFPVKSWGKWSFESKGNYYGLNRTNLDANASKWIHVAGKSSPKMVQLEGLRMMKLRSHPSHGSSLLRRGRCRCILKNGKTEICKTCVPIIVDEDIGLALQGKEMRFYENWFTYPTKIPMDNTLWM